MTAPTRLRGAVVEALGTLAGAAAAGCAARAAGVWRCDADGRPVLVAARTAAGADAREAVAAAGPRRDVAVPVDLAGRRWGVLSLTGLTPGDDDGTLRRAGDLARLVARLLDDDAELRRLGRRVDEHAAFARVARRVAGAAPPSEVLGLVAEQVATLLGLDVGTVARYDGDRVHLMAGWTRPGSGLRAGEQLGSVPLGVDGLLARIHRTGQAARIDDYADLGGDVSQIVEPFAIRSSVGAPVLLDGRVWGAVVALSPRPRAIPADAEERLVRFAELVDLSVRNAAHLTELEDRAATDPLTGLANRGSFDERLHDEFERSRRHARPLALALLDLDHFKSVNDRHGHGAGDAVLREVSRRLRAEIRPGDLLARLGGEEFAWILPEADAADGWAAAERARDAIGRAEFPDVGRVTISAGVADTRDGSDARTLYAAADQALYAAKAEGRNACVRFAAGIGEERRTTAEATRAHTVQARVAMQALARVVDARHPGTRGHSERVGDLAVALWTALGRPVESAVLLRDAALLHDVGEVSGGDPGQHPVLGAQLVHGILSADQADWIRAHHERFDGTGYPDGRKGAAIPVEARVLAVADAWDGMVHDRPDGAALTRRDAIATLQDGAGTRFCPEVVAAFVRLERAGVFEG